MQDASRVSQPVLSLRAGASRRTAWGTLRGLILLASGMLYALHFSHLGADFPHNSPWHDLSKYTDEGWYGDGAIRHFILGRWYLPGDFNPAAAMPVWPLLEAIVFSMAGVSLAAARALTLVTFGITLLVLYALLERRDGEAALGRPCVGAPLAVLLACANPFLFAFDRLAIAEPSVAALGVCAVWLARSLQPWNGHGMGAVRFHPLGKAASLGVVLALLGLSKPTAVALFPAILYLLWRGSGGRWRDFLRLAAVPLGVAVSLWAFYFALLLRFHLWEDFRYLFDANSYTGFQLEPLSEVVRHTLLDGSCMGGALYGLFALAMATTALLRRRFFADPLAGAWLLWGAGYLLLLGYHNNQQPRYYVLLAVPVIALFAMALEELLGWAATQSRSWWLAAVFAVAVCVAAIAVPGVRQEAAYVDHPDYSYLNAARQIAATVRADPRQSPWVLSVSGSDLTLMTGLPSIDDDFGTLDLDERVRQYRPGWYLAWNEMDDDKMDALRELYRPVRVAAFPAMDDPDRNLLILYRLDALNGSAPAAGSDAGQPLRRAPVRASSRVRRSRGPDAGDALGLEGKTHPAGAHAN